jgi:general nucleoside transport system permease protein
VAIALQFTRRESVPAYLYIVAALSVLASIFVVSSVLILSAHAALGYSYLLIFDGAFGSRVAITATLTRATPLIFTALAATVAFWARFYNVGAEGQLYFGALAAVMVARGNVEVSPVLLWPLMIGAGFIAGALLVFGPAVAKIRFGVDEVVTTLLLNFVALLFVSMMLEGPLRDVTAMGWPQSQPIIDALRLPRLVPRTRLDAGLLGAIVLAIVLRVAMTRTLFGFEINAVGANIRAARFAGIPTGAVLLKAALISGGIAGLGGVCEVAGRAGYLTLDMAVGYGFIGIAIAMLAQLDALAVLAVSILVAALIVGGDAMGRVVGVPTYMTDVVVAVALLSALPAALFVRYQVRWR